jgi:hypothetical protein
MSWNTIAIIGAIVGAIVGQQLVSGSDTRPLELMTWAWGSYSPFSAPLLVWY